MSVSEGFITQDDTDFMQKVVEILREAAPTLGARVEHTGGGIFCIYVELPEMDRFMYWGTPGETWAADINDLQGDYLDETLYSDVPCNTLDAQAVAQAIISTVEQYRSQS